MTVGDEILRRRAQELKLTESTEIQGEDLVDLICFTIGTTRFGFTVREVQEIQPLTDFTPIPCTPDFILGAANLRGNILTLLDLKKFLGLPEEGLQDARRVIVIHSTVYLIGIVVRDVFDLVRVPVQNILPPLASEGGIDSRYVRGLLPDLSVILKGSAILEDPRIVLDEEGVSSLSKRMEED